MTVNTIGAPAVRRRQCPLCEALAGQPCQDKPSGDHLARYLDAYTAGQLTKAYMAMAVGELVVVDVFAVVTRPACRYCGRSGTRLEARPCCSRPEHEHQELACADTDDCLAFLLGGTR
jgi:hypothetical protein